MGLFRAHTAIIQTLLSSLSATLSFTFSTTCTPYVTLILHSCFHLMRCVFAPTLFHSQLFSSLSLLFLFSFLLSSSLVFCHHLSCTIIITFVQYYSHFHWMLSPLSSSPPFLLFSQLDCIASCLFLPLLVSPLLVLSCLVLSGRW